MFHIFEKQFMDALDKCLATDGSGNTYVRTVSVAAGQANSGTLRQGDFNQLMKSLFQDNGDGTFSLKITT